MVGALLMVVAALACSQVDESARDLPGFPAAVRLVGQGDLLGALAEADREDDPLLRARARVYVLYSGRDWLGALSAARAGLEAYPEDAWLLDRAAAASIALQAPEDVLRFVERLERSAAVPGRSAEERDDALGKAATYRARARSLSRAEERRRAALRRARSTTLGLLLVGAAALVELARRLPDRGVRAIARAGR